MALHDDGGDDGSWRIRSAWAGAARCGRPCASARAPTPSTWAPSRVAGRWRRAPTRSSCRRSKESSAAKKDDDPGLLFDADGGRVREPSLVMTAAARAAAPPALAPFSLKDAPSFIERQFPVGRLSAEAYKERKAGAGQTLTALGSYWKGRKPLILVRAVVLGCLLPATDDAAADLDIFLKLMAMDDGAFGRRFDESAAEFARAFPAYAELATEERGRRRVWRDDLSETERQERVAEALASLPYAERVKIRAAAGGVRRGGTARADLGRREPSSRHERALAAGTRRAIGRRALRPSAEGGGHVLRRRVDPLRGGAYRLRRLRFRPQSDRLHADLGRFQHHRRRRRRSAPRSRRRKRRSPPQSTPRSRGSASSMTRMATGQRRISIAWKRAVRRPAGWCRWRRPG